MQDFGFHQEAAAREFGVWPRAARQDDDPDSDLFETRPVRVARRPRYKVRFAVVGGNWRPELGTVRPCSMSRYGQIVRNCPGVQRRPSSR